MNTHCHSHIQRGLLLLEVLAALMLLTLLAAALTPLIGMLSDPLPATAPESGRDDVVFELGQVADRFMDSPAEFGIDAETLSTPDALLPGTLPWPEDPDRPPIVVRRFLPGSPSADPSRGSHCWILFQYQSIAVARWIPLQIESGDTQP